MALERRMLIRDTYLGNAELGSSPGWVMLS
jgi:hypothetical protein